MWKDTTILNMYILLSYIYLLNNSCLLLHNISILSGIVSRHDLKSLKELYRFMCSIQVCDYLYKGLIHQESVPC